MSAVRRRHFVAAGVLGVACSLAACGAGRLAPGAQRPPSPGRRTAHGYRWLVRTGGTAPTIRQENRARGTRGWRLAGPAADVGGIATGTVRGYVAEPAVLSGQLQSIDVSAPGARTVTIRIYRMGWYGGSGGREVLVARDLPVVVQPRCHHSAATGLTECRWHPTLRFRIPPALPSGVYISKLSARTGASDCLFVVRSRRAQPLLAQLPTATYEAYNGWGGDSLYPGGVRVRSTGTTQGVAVSYDRPYDSITGAGQFFARDVAMIRFLERYGYPVSYTTSESVDQAPGQVKAHRGLIDFGHSEYWSGRQVRAFARAARAGTSLLFFGSDTMVWRVRFESGGARGGRPGHRVVADKGLVGGVPTRGLASSVFRDQGELTGSAYTGCITPRLPGAGPPVYRYYAWTAAQPMRPRWLFAGSGVRPGVPIPGIVGYELDQRVRVQSAGSIRVGGGSAPCQSGVAAEPGRAGPGPGGAVADTTLRILRSGALVFDTGTLGWELGLTPVLSASPDAPLAPDPRIVRMTRNLLRHALRRPRGRQ